MRGVEAFSFNDRGEIRQRFLETIGTLGQEGRVIAIDWHQVSDTWRLNRREAARADQHTGANYALGQLVFYRTKFQNKSKIAPNASPALMAGWKLEFGMRYKGVLALLDYQALREGKVVIASAPDREVYARDKIVFPLADLAEKALESFSDPSVESLDPQEPLPVR